MSNVKINSAIFKQEFHPIPKLHMNRVADAEFMSTLDIMGALPPWFRQFTVFDLEVVIPKEDFILPMIFKN